MNSKGLTLPEVLIVLVIMAILASLLGSLLVNNTSLFYKQSSKINQGLGLNDSLTQLKSDLTQATSVSVSYPEIAPVSFTTNSQTLVLKLASIDVSKNIIDNTFDYFVYTVSQNKLWRKVYPNAASSRKSADSVMANNVSVINFEYFDLSGQSISPVSAAKVRVSLTLNEKAADKYETNSATTEANLRND